MGAYANITNRESPYSWAYRLHELSDNSFLPGNAAAYKKVMQNGYPQMENIPFSYPALNPETNSFRFPTKDRLSKAAIALSDLYDVHQPLLRAPIPKDYFQKATNFLQNFEYGADASGWELNPIRTVQGLGFTGEDQLQDVADLAEILRILDQFGESNVQNQIRKVTELPGIFGTSPLSDKDRLRWADLYKTVSPALRQPNRDYSVFKPYLTPAGYKNLMNIVGQAYKDRTSNWVKEAIPAESSQDVTQALKDIKSSNDIVPLNPKDNDPVMAVMNLLEEQ